MKLTNRSQNGSASFAALMAVMSLSVAGVYALNQSKVSKFTVDQAKLTNAIAETHASSMNALSVYRALLGEKRINVTVYEPSLYPLNYFDLDWNLARNTKIPSESIQDAGAKVIVLKTFDSEINSSPQISEIFSGSKSALKAPTVLNRVRFVQANLAAGKSKLIDSVDVEVTSDVVNKGVKSQQRIRARIPVSIPSAVDPVIEFSPAGANAWVRDPTNLSGPTDIRVLGSGVITYARLMIGAAGPYLLGGFDEATGEIKHKATNALAKNVEIGRITYDFKSGTTSSIDYKIIDPKVSCRAVPVISGAAASVDVVVTAELVNVSDTVSENGRTIKTITASTSDSGTNPRDLAFEQVNGMCEAQCKYINPDVAGDEGPNYLTKIFQLRGNQVENRKFDDFSWGYMRAIRDETGVLDAKICEDYSAVYKAVSNAVGRPAVNGDPFIDHYDAMEYTYYQEPACNKKFLFARTSCGCFQEATQITLGDGVSTKSIEHLTEYDLVWNPILKKAQPILRMTRGPESLAMFKISTKKSSVSVTRGHPFPLVDGRIVQAIDLSVGESVQVNGNWEEIVGIETVKSPTPPIVWNLELGGAVSRDGHFILANGIVTGDLKVQEELGSEGK
ncbi:MAG: hypothetical protein EOP10_05570 [Proteobacteria bacterium]|nr:MAG: hypothetical protein EOP10_05570 [Pseudomonadota bacterium]